MKQFICYLPNGKITRSGSCQNKTFNLQASEGESIIEGVYKGNQYIENGQIIDMPPQPERDWVFDYETKQWVQDIAALKAQALHIRQYLLNTTVDRLNPIWWSSMTPEKQQEWVDYRQHLLDITDQPEFPIKIDWGTPPSEE